VRAVPGLFDLVGQEEPARRLAQLVASGRLPHALLFEGPEGVGKYAAALALAGALLCRKPIRPGQACGECSQCLKVEGGNHADLHQIRTTEPRIKIAEVREAERALALRPVEGQRKLLLIEDVHKMTIEAQNALLKTLEEPRGSTHIILTTSRLRNVLPTVVSRCQRLQFFALAPEQILRILGKEESQAARMIAVLAQGSVGRAQAIEIDAVIEARDRVAALDRKLDRPTPQAAIDAIELAAELGQDRAEMAKALDLLALWLHDQMVLSSGARRDELANADKGTELEELANRRGLTDVLSRARTVMEARRQIDLPFNLNATMIAEQMCLALAGHAVMKPVPLW
jgi:DNA polymerase-3 subunit delta'